MNSEQEYLDPKEHVRPLKFFLTVNKGELRWFILNVIFYSLGSLSVIMAFYFLSKTVDSVTKHQDNTFQLIVFVLLSIVGYEVFYRIGHIFEVLMLSHFRANTQKALFAHISSLGFGYFADRFAGEIAHKISATALAFENLAQIAGNYFFEGGATVLIAIIVLSRLHYLFALFLVLWVTAFLFACLPIARRMRQAAGEYALVEAQTTGKLVDVYGNISAVKVYGKSSDRDRMNKQIEEEMRGYQNLGKWDIIMYNFQGISVIVLTAGLIWITSFLYQQGAIAVPAIVFVATVGLRLFDVAWELGRNVAHFIRFRGEALQNLEDLVVASAILDGKHSDVRHPEVGVEYRKVVFGYNSQVSVLDNFSLEIKAHEKVGIVGLSGAGKTTFANLLLRFFDPQSGTILINGLDIKDMSQEALRAHVSFVSQDTSLFHTTVAENIAYGSAAASPEDIKRVAALAYADDFIKDLPHGYESVVGERGVKLSGGQRQRIIIARALLADRPLFLLDEATSALDSSSEGKIQKGLEQLMKGKTVIAIAHRLSTLAHMDRIIFIENGRIIEDGSHKELLSKKGKYAQLWEMQAGGFLPTEQVLTEG